MLNDRIKNIIKNMTTSEQLELVNAYRTEYNLSEIVLNIPTELNKILDGLTPFQVVHALRLGFFDENDLFATYDDFDDALLSGDLFHLVDMDVMVREIVDNDLDLGCAAIRDALKLVSERERLADILKTLPDELLADMHNCDRIDTRPCIYRKGELDDIADFLRLTPTQIATWTVAGSFSPNDNYFIYEDERLRSHNHIPSLIDMKELADALLDADTNRVKELLK